MKENQDMKYTLSYSADTDLDNEIEDLLNDIDTIYESLEPPDLSKVVIAIWGVLYLYIIALVFLHDRKPLNIDNTIYKIQQDNSSCIHPASPMQKQYEIPLEFLLDVD